MNKRTNEQTNKETNKPKNKQTNKQANKQKQKTNKKQTKNKQTNGRMNKWTNKQTNKQTNKSIDKYYSLSTNINAKVIIGSIIMGSCVPQWNYCGWSTWESSFCTYPSRSPCSRASDTSVVQNVWHPAITSWPGHFNTHSVRGTCNPFAYSCRHQWLLQHWTRLFVSMHRKCEKKHKEDRTE